MRNSALLVTAVLIAIFVVPPSISVASATPAGLEVSQSPKLYYTVGVDQSGATRFLPATLIIPQVNITLNITFVNNYTVGGGMVHTFSIANSDNSAIVINNLTTGSVAPGSNLSFEFHINSLTNITYKGVSFTPESSGQGILWFSILTVIVALQDLSGISDTQTDSYMALFMGMVFLLLAAAIDIYRREFMPDEMIHKIRRPKIVLTRAFR